MQEPATGRQRATWRTTFAMWSPPTSAGRRSKHAIAHPRVRYLTERAERCSLPDASVDLVSAAACVHWLDRPEFYRQVRRVVRSGGAIALYSYGIAPNDDALGKVMDHLVRNVLRPAKSWPEPIDHILTEYRQIDFPFDEFTFQAPPATSTGNLEDLIALMETWSIVALYKEASGHDPIAEVCDDLTAAWRQKGPIDRPRTLEWPISCRIGRV